MMNSVFVGYDTRLDIVYNVCKHSILRRSNNVNVIPLVQTELREKGLYTRPIDTRGSTEFTITRFLTPYLSNYEGWSLFCDCDFLWTVDINEVFALKNEDYSVMVVKHDYITKTETKMDNKIQYKLPRKNWSSLMLFNNRKCKNLNIELVNSAEPSYLHRFNWLDDSQIGEISVEFNFLAGYYDGPFKAIHYTDGGPWFENYKTVDHGELWMQELEHYESTKLM